MGWIYRKANEHVCAKPRWDYSMKVGDVWECDYCKVRYRVSKIEFEDRPAGAIWVSWDTLPKAANPDPRDYSASWLDR